MSQSNSPREGSISQIRLELGNETETNVESSKEVNLQLLARSGGDEKIVKTKQCWPKVAAVLFGGALVSTMALILLLIAKDGGLAQKNKGRAESKSDEPINVIFMISDGFGPASETLARQYYQTMNGLKVNWRSPLDEMLVGSSRTQSSDSLITDSAAGATAFSCGLKSYNGAIGVTDDKRPCGTILEAAKKKGMYTGLVSTSRITHATPGSFAAHVIDRNMEDLIAEYLIGNYSLGRTVDLMLGGGYCKFVPSTEMNGCRMDNRNLLKEAINNKGFNVIQTRKEFEQLEHRLPLLGLFTASHMNYEIDREKLKEPSLAEMTEKALSILKKQSKRDETSFFVMIEGSRIDMAAHSNDPAAHLQDILAYWKAIDVSKQFVNANPNTVLISVSDHETGGVTLARQLNKEYPEYLWNPHVLHNVKNSSETVSKYLYNIDSDIPTISSYKLKYDLLKSTILPKWYGIKDYTEEEVVNLANTTDIVELRQHLSDLVSTRAQIGWSTHGHSAVDVNLYAYGYKASQLRGNVENTDVGKFVKDILSLDLDYISKIIANDPVSQKTGYRADKWQGRDLSRLDLVDVDAIVHRF
ncbi:Alkaline phosphatase [Zancudomyces culisetae]|uniref:Alkaline phosphatase n=1 Tax=Zancudomyces culisetae TaxID=1213189 RepID=A0A1R1PU46_ZANCU|nr:Alkaline phosphatase [Zancudomyces culisetae]|eukprot:OMH84474.1 Alkaline phosphatase [Zancudomyces culisetae]